MHPQPNAQQQRDEVQKKDEMRREEQERTNLESQVREFDAYEFYASMNAWAKSPVPGPVPRTIRLTPLKKRIIMRQPIPLARPELREMQRLSSECGRLLYLLRAIDQKGLECPYVHQLNRGSLEKAVEKCRQLNEAGTSYMNGRGVLSRLFHLFSGIGVASLKKDVASFKNRLEAILMICRHEEFARDLMQLRRVVTSRTEGAPTLGAMGEQAAVRQSTPKATGKAGAPALPKRGRMGA